MTYIECFQNILPQVRVLSKGVMLRCKFWALWSFYIKFLVEVYGDLPTAFWFVGLWVTL